MEKISKMLENICISNMPVKGTDTKEKLFKELKRVNEFIYEERHNMTNPDCIFAYKLMQKGIMDRYNITDLEFANARKVAKYKCSLLEKFKL